jgi:2',3'-cyclic-nucleotide 2'-phosphodiesterase (5'-nucleotidase family)
MKKTITSLLFCFTLLSSATLKAEPYQLTLLHTNDLHAHFLPFKNDGSKCDYTHCNGGFAKIKSFIHTYAKQL